MLWEFLVTLAIAIPVILFPAAFVWYLNTGWISLHTQEAEQERRASREKNGRGVTAAGDNKGWQPRKTQGEEV